MTGDPGGHTVTEAHRIAFLRSEALVALRDGPLDRSTLQDRLETSKTTAYRTTRALTDHGFVVQENGAYSLTAAGEVATERAEGLCLALSAVEHVDPLFDLIDRTALDLDPALFADATVTHAASADPYAPIRRFWAVVSQADRLSLLYNTIHAPDSLDRYAELEADGLALTIVYDPATAERNLASIEDHRPKLRSADGVDLYVGARPFGGGVAVTSDRVGLMGYDPNTGTPVVAADTDDPAAIEWGDALVERHCGAAEPVNE